MIGLAIEVKDRAEKVNGLLSRYGDYLDPKTVVWILLLVFLLVSIGGVLATLIVASFWSTGPFTQGGSFTLQNYINTYSQASTYQLWANTIVIAAGVMVWTNFLGIGIAWLVARTNVPYRGLIDMIMIIPFMVPGYLIAVGYMFILGPRIGVVSSFLMDFGINISIYSYWGIVFTKGISFCTLPYLLTSASFRNFDPSLEDAARMSGSGVVDTLRRVTLPVLAPSITASSVLVFTKALETFSVPAFLGLPANPPIFVFSTRIYDALSTTPQNHGLAIALSTTLLAVSAVGLIFQRRVTSSQEQYTTITGQDFNPRRYDLGRYRYILLAGAGVILLGGIGLPFFMLVIASVSSTWAGSLFFLNDAISFTLDHYVSVLGFDDTLTAFTNSFVLAAVGSFITMLLASFISYFVVKVDEDESLFISSTSEAGDTLAFLPAALPGVVLGVGFIWYVLFLPQFGLYGSLWLLGLAYVVKELPIANQTTYGGMSQVSDELEDQARVSGAGWLHTMKDIVLPLLKDNFLAGYLLLFMAIMRELSTSILLYSNESLVVAVYIFSLKLDGAYEQLAATSVMLLLAMFVVLLFFRRVLNVSIVEEKRS